MTTCHQGQGSSVDFCLWSGIPPGEAAGLVRGERRTMRVSEKSRAHGSQLFRYKWRSSCLWACPERTDVHRGQETTCLSSGAWV